MARLHEWREDLHMQEAQAPSAPEFRISGTIIVGIDLSASLLWSNFRESLRCSMYDFEYNIAITVPSVWPVYARKKMFQVIRKANILSDNVHLISKFIPDIEAASIALVLDLIKPLDRMQPILRGGNVVMICDCGGFTTEAAAYEIRTIRPLGMKQLTQRECILVGGALIDNNFMNLLKTKIESIGQIQNVCPVSEIDLVTGQCLREFAYRKKI
ncbi:hypothetical protein FVEN_g11773 [Fusarium venenatum]|nr:hypothetical protein FVEN_g11773 [Fusarium venenatum]